MSSASDRDSSEFHLSRLTIGTKLMLIISAIIGVALIAMIAIATYFFKNDNTVRIQETNIDLNRVYARNLEYTLQAIARNMRLVASVIDRYPNARGTVEDRVFENNENLIFVGVYEGNQLAQKNRIVNPDFLIEHDLVTGDIAGLTARYAEQFPEIPGRPDGYRECQPGFSIAPRRNEFSVRQQSRRQSRHRCFLSHGCNPGAFSDFRHSRNVHGQR